MAKRSSKIVSFFLAVVFVFSLLPGLKVNAAVVDSGNCGVNGDNVTWTLDDEGTLTISGTGAMAGFGFSSADSIPWKDYINSIKTIVIGDDVTSIGQLAFKNCIIFKKYFSI